MGNHWREVACYWISAGDSGERVKPPLGGKIVFENEFHGDRDDDWLASYDSNGKEVQRWNAHYVSLIEWKQEAPDADR